MRASVSIEVILVALFLVAGLTVVINQINNLIGMIKRTDPMFSGRATGIKITTLTYLLSGCENCRKRVYIYVPPDTTLKVSDNNVYVEYNGRAVYQAAPPIRGNLQITGEYNGLITLIGEASGARLG